MGAPYTAAPAGPVGPAHRPVLVVLRALGLGDLLTGLPALRALGRAFPSHHRILCTPASLAALAVHAGAADEVVAVDGLGAPLPPSLAGADIAVNLHGRGPQSHRRLLGTRPHRLMAYAHPEVAESAGGPVWAPSAQRPDDEHEVSRWCRLLRESGIPADPSDLDLVHPGLPVPAWARGATVVHPGASSEARRWPVARFVEVVAAERRAGREVIVTGGTAERDRAEAVTAQAGLASDRNLAGRTDVMALATVIGVAGRLVSGDTGVAHLATALGTPSVVLFGPTAPARWGPPADRALHRPLWAGAAGDPHATVIDPGLAAITVDDVIDALARLPARPINPATEPAHDG